MTRFSWVTDPSVREQLGRVEELIAGVAGDAPVHRQLRSTRSKRIRPALLLLAARFGPDAPDSLLVRTAAGLELTHEATLYHDDVIDEARLRRGAPSVQQACGPAVAGLAGLELLCASAELFSGLPARQRRSIGRACGALCRGYLREIESMGAPDITARERVRIMRDKAARYFDLAGRLGAAIAHAPAPVVRALGRFGLLFGLSFQLADDLADLAWSETLLGKPPGSDLRDGLCTLPVLLALDALGEETRALRCALVAAQTGDAAAIASARALVERAGGIARAQQTLKAWVAEARAQIAALPQGSASTALEHLLDLFPTHRNRLREYPALAEGGSCDA